MEKRQQKQEGTGEQQQWLCMICLDLLNQPMKCSSCQKCVCQSHAVNLNRCPNCRMQPYQPLLDTELELNLLPTRELKREKQKQTTTFECFGKNCIFKGNYQEMVEHHTKEHPYFSLNRILYGDYCEIQDKEPVENLTQSERARALRAFQNPKIPPEGQKKKAINYFQAIKMMRHCNICPNTQCHTLYAGPWGAFIGGVMGRTHFDLTSCSKGRQMNRQLGWNYNDFRH